MNHSASPNLAYLAHHDARHPHAQVRGRIRVDGTSEHALCHLHVIVEGHGDVEAYESK